MFPISGKQCQLGSSVVRSTELLSERQLTLVTLTYAHENQSEMLCNLIDFVRENVVGRVNIFWVVVSDGPSSECVRALLEASGIPHHYLELPSPKRDKGNAARNAAYEYIFDAKMGGVVYNLDDDNAISADLLPRVVKEVLPGKVAIFGMQYGLYLEYPTLSPSNEYQCTHGGQLHRPVPVDMGAFAFDASLLQKLRKPLWTFQGFGGESEFIMKLLSASGQTKSDIQYLDRHPYTLYETHHNAWKETRRSCELLSYAPKSCLPSAIRSKTIGFGTTTAPGIAPLIRTVLSLSSEEEQAKDHYGAKQASDRWRTKCGGFDVSSPIPRQCLLDAGYVAYPPNSKPVREQYHFNPEELDVVVPSIRHLDFLESWKPWLVGHKVIIIQDGDPSVQLSIPSWVHYELYNRHDIEAALREDSWIISSRDASIRNFGFLVSRARYIWSLDDDCFPAKDPHNNNNNREVDAPLEHVLNLKSPSTPYFFNTLYDPYADGADFVRGYPYSLRDGVPTVVSHGIWLNVPDYDAPTQLAKQWEVNNNLARVTVTIPHRTLYPLCSMNVAFDRKLIGAAFMQGLMGDGQPWGRYDDMWAGWVSKVIADHLGYGHKSGYPYILHRKQSDPFTNLAKEYKGIQWQETLILDFFRHRVHFPPEAQNAESCMLVLSDLVETHLGHLHEYFPRMAKAMRLWVKHWQAAQQGLLMAKPSRSQIGIWNRKDPVPPIPFQAQMEKC